MKIVLLDTLTYGDTSLEAFNALGSVVTMRPQQQMK